MDNYVIWKDVNSNTIPGLIIQELPSISKPPMRYNAIDVDGRNGDIIDELGYGAYDKTLLIGLANNFDIDQVISFFSGSGTLILSNESDKYYNARILEQIDYVRLLRFKTAEVTFHVQPFKYKVAEDYVEETISSQESITVNNLGNLESEPIIYLYGSGDVTFTLNGLDVFTINIDEDYVVVDSSQQNAYFNSVLKNRNMTGDFPKLQPGENTITWTGTLTKIIIDPKSRWL